MLSFIADGCFNWIAEEFMAWPRWWGSSGYLYASDECGYCQLSTGSLAMNGRHHGRISCLIFDEIFGNLNFSRMVCDQSLLIIHYDDPKLTLHLESPHNVGGRVIGLRRPCGSPVNQSQYRMKDLSTGIFAWTKAEWHTEVFSASVEMRKLVSSLGFP